MSVVAVYLPSSDVLSRLLLLVPEEFHEAVIEDSIGAAVCRLGLQRGGKCDEGRIHHALVRYLQQS